MTVNAYEMLFTDQNINREFIIQPYTKNGPQTPTTGVDPSAATANTTLFLYGKGTPDYGERLQEDMVYMLEHFNNPTEPSFPIPGQIWSNTSVNPPQLYVYNAYKYTVVSNSGNIIAIQSTNNLDDIASVLARFTALGTTKSFVVYSPTFVPYTFTQQATPGYPQISGSMVLLSVTPSTPLSSMAGYITGGWEDVWQGNRINVLRTNLNANNQFIQNIPLPVLSGDAANKAYVDAAVTGGTLVLSDLGDVQFATPGFPQTNSVLYYNGSKWTDQLVSSLPFVQLAGSTMTGALILNADPTASLGAVTKQYVDNEPLSSQYTNIVTPSNNDLLAYDGITLKWINKTATAAGVLPLTGGIMSGAINMGGNSIVNLPALLTPYPVNPTDAATKAYVDSLVGGTNGITSATYDDSTGILTINQTTSPTVIAIPGFLSAPGGILQASAVNYVPIDPATVYSVPGMFFQSTLVDNVTVDPTNIRINDALAQIDLGLGNFAEPRQRLAFSAVNSKTVYNLNTGVPLTVTTFPSIQYVVGSNNLFVYVNGVKQVPADFGKYNILGINTITNVSGVTFSVGTSTLTVPGNYVSVLRVGVNFSISGTSTTNDGNYIVVSSQLVGSNTSITVISNITSTTPGTTPFVSSGTGTLTYGPFDIMPAMPTGYQLGGPSNSQSLLVGVNGLSAVTVTIDTSTTDCSTFGLLANAVNSIAAKNYINPITNVVIGAFGNFSVAGDRTAEFTTGTTFVVRYSTGNNGSYTVGPGVPTYSAGQTTIPITTTIPNGTIDGIIFKDTWGFTMTIQNGTIVFYSNIAGSGSSVTPTDSGLLAGITGTYWPVTITTPLTGTVNPITPNDFGYKEIGLHGYQSSLIELTSALTSADVIEVVVEREVIYNKTNPTITAVTA